MLTREQQAERLVTRLRFVREARRLSQGDVAEMLGVVHATVSNYEKGLRPFSFATLLAWADALGIDLSLLVLRISDEGYDEEEWQARVLIEVLPKKARAVLSTNWSLLGPTDRPDKRLVNDSLMVAVPV